MLRGSDAVVVSEDGLRIRRAQPLTSVEEMAKAVDARTLYAGEARPPHLSLHRIPPMPFWHMPWPAPEVAPLSMPLFLYMSLSSSSPCPCLYLTRRALSFCMPEEQSVAGG